MKIFRYKQSATYVRVILIFTWMLLVVLPVTFNWFPFNEQGHVETMVLLVLYGLLPVIYFFYLIQVAQTAVITLDDSTIGYHDKYTRIIARWNEISEFNRQTIRLKDGRAIFLKLGVQALENWQEFEKTVVEKAHLSPARRRGVHVHRWVCAPEGQAMDVS